MTYKEIFKLMKASRLGAFMESLDYSSLSTEQRNRLSSKWIKKIEAMSDKTLAKLMNKFPNIIYWDNSHAPEEGIWSYRYQLPDGEWQNWSAANDFNEAFGVVTFYAMGRPFEIVKGFKTE